MSKVSWLSKPLAKLIHVLDSNACSNKPENCVHISAAVSKRDGADDGSHKSDGASMSSDHVMGNMLE